MPGWSVDNMLPLDAPVGSPTFDMTFQRTNLAKSFVFNVVELRQSRVIGSVCEFVYDVKPQKQNDDLFTHYLWTEEERTWGTGDFYMSDEVAIAWNVWEHLGMTFFDKTLVKQWPPVCERYQHNHYRVTVRYVPLYIVNFQVVATKQPRLEAIDALPYTIVNNVATQINPAAMDGDHASHFKHLNVDSQGKIQGIDVIEPMFTWTERWNWGPVSGGLKIQDEDGKPYFDIITELTGTVNSASFRGFKAGEVLFGGVSGRSVGPLQWEMDYQFSARRKVASRPVGDIIITPPEAFSSPWIHIDIDPKPIERRENGNDKLRWAIDTITLQKIYKSENFDHLKTVPQLVLGEAHHLEKLDELDKPVPFIGFYYKPAIEAVFTDY